jgi:hypothetical protein
MKSRTKPALRVVPAMPVQFSLNVQGVLAEVSWRLCSAPQSALPKPNGRTAGRLA